MALLTSVYFFNEECIKLNEKHLFLNNLRYVDQDYIMTFYTEQDMNNSSWKRVEIFL